MDDRQELNSEDAKLPYTAMLEAQMEGDEGAMQALVDLSNDPEKLWEVLGGEG